MTTPWYDGYLDKGADGGSAPIWHAGPSAEGPEPTAANGEAELEPCGFTVAGCEAWRADLLAEPEPEAEIEP